MKLRANLKNFVMYVSLSEFFVSFSRELTTACNAFRSSNNEMQSVKNSV